MSSTILKPLAQALADLGDGITLSSGVTAKGYLWERSDFDHLPAVVVEPSDGARTPLDTAEGRFGARDWFDEYDVSLYVDLHDIVDASEQMTELLEAFIQAVDDNHTLGSALVLDCKVTSWEKFVRPMSNSRRLGGYICTVSVHHEVEGI